MRYAQFWSVIAVASISTGVAAAEDNLKGTYAFTGTQVCLTAPAGFKEDSKGNLAIPNGDSTVQMVSFAGQIIYNGDGTGKVTGRFVTTVAPPAPAAIGAGTYSYSFTHTPVSNHSVRATMTSGTYQGAIESGPAAGQQFTIDVYSNVYQVSSDGKRLSTAVEKPFLQKITLSGSPQNPVPRICSLSGSQLLLD